MKGKVFFILSIFFILSSFVSATDFTINNDLFYTYDENDIISTNIIDLANNYNGTCINMASNCNTIPGQIINASSFDGTNDVIDTGFSLDNSVSFTINTWIKYNSAMVGDDTFIGQADGHSTADAGVWMDVYTNNVRIGQDTATGTDGVLTGSTTLSHSTWYLITLTYDGTDMRLYINGDLKDTFSNPQGAIDPTTNNIAIGDRYVGGTLKTFNGDIDETSIYSYVFNNTQVEEYYNLTSNPYTSINSTEFLITAKSYWDNSNIINYSVDINGTIYNTTNGTINTNLYANDTSLYNISFFSDDTFNITYENYNVSASLVGILKQSEINISPIELITNNSISNFSIKIGSDIVCNVTGTSCVFYPDADNYTLTLIDNTGAETYHTTSNNIEVNALDNTSFNIYGHGHELFIYARTTTNTTINNFTATLSSLNITDERELNTTTGVINFDVIHNTYNITIDAPGYALDDSQLVSVTQAQQNYTLYFYLYTTNSINFTFKDEDSKDLIDSETIYIELISDVFSSNYSTSNGYLYVDLLSPSIYNMRYWSNYSYEQKFYYFDLENRTHTDLTLYLSKNDTGEEITISVYDEVNNLIEDAYIKVLRYDIDTNSYLQQEIIKTNFEGEAKFIGEIGTEYYKYIVDYPFGTSVKETSPSYLYSNTLVIQVLLGEDIAEDFYNTEGVTNTLTFNNASNNFRFTWSDTNNVASQACLKVYKYTGLTNTLYDSTCTSGSSGTILIPVLNTTGSNYEAKSYIYWGSDEEFLQSYKKSFAINTEEGKELRLFLVALLTITFAFIGLWSLPVALVIAPLPLVITSIINFINVEPQYAIGFEIIGIILAILIAKRS